MHPPKNTTGDEPQRNSYARVLGSATAGVSELLLFHPVDTVAKRLMSNQTVAVTGQPVAQAVEALNKVVFKEASQMGTVRKYLSLFPGLGFGAGYKILQRVYKFGGQPFVRDYITRTHSERFERAFGQRRAKSMMEATAGSIIGVGEIALLPLDVLKIKAQTNPESLAGRGVVDIFAKEGRGLYRGAGWTAARNAPGSFALFGGASVMKEYVFQLERPGDATLFQTFCASIAGAVSSITVAAPLDVIKVRVQNRPFDSPESGMVIVRKLLATEGPGAFFKGLTPKIIVVGPKLIFSFTVAQRLISFLERSWDPNSDLNVAKRKNSSA
ncbi:unnamed protein product [Ectocarpus sp. 4 AP-2014]